MRRLIIVALFLLVTMVACGNNNEAISLPLPDVLDGENEAATGAELVEPERVQATPTPPLPPTFTPNPMAHQGHLYLLPVSGADGSVRYVHVVRPGDTLAALSALYGVPQAVLAHLNHIEDRNLIQVGMALEIPVAEFQH